MDYFYRPQYGSGIGFTNLLDASGNIDNSLVQALKETLNTANSNITNSYDIYHTSWRSGGKSHQSVGECTWWAYGRGLQYCETNGTLPANGFKNGYGNGGDFLDQAQSQFNTGKLPRRVRGLFGRMVPGATLLSLRRLPTMAPLLSRNLDEVTGIITKEQASM